MDTNEIDKQTIYIRLINGDEPQEIANDMDITVSKVTRCKKDITEAQEEGRVQQLLELPDYALDRLSKEAKHLDLPPEMAGEVIEHMDGIVDGVKGLQKLEHDLQDTAIYLNGKIKNMARLAENVGELNELVDALAKLQNAFFAKGAVVQVNTQINGAGTYGQFLGDAPGSVDN